MKKGTLISIFIALVAIAGALLGLVAYMRSRRCLECGDVEEDYTPRMDEDYEADYYVDSHPIPEENDDALEEDAYSVEDTENDDAAE